MRTLGRFTLVTFAAVLASCSSNSVGGNNGIAGPAPAIASITPSNSPPAGGGYALMKGFGFKTNATVQVGATYASFVTVVDAETLSFEIPAGVLGGANVVVTNSDGGKATFTQGITYVASTAAAPQVTKVTPNSGPITGGTYAQLNGQGFADGAIVLVGGAPAPLVNVLASGLITAILPPHTGAGTANVVVTNPDGQSGVLSGGFAYSDLSAAQGPSVTGVAPDEGPQAGGNSALIKVTNASANALLFIGGQPATYGPATGGLAAVMPAAAHHGLADVAVTNANGQSGILPGAYNYIDSTLVAPPTIARIVPDQSPPAGGGRVVIDGSGFDPGAQVLFGDAPATGVVVANSNAITCLVPPNAAGPVDVTVQNSDGSLVKFAQGFTYAASALPAPTVTAVSPNTGPATGGTVAEIDGTNFVAGAILIVGGSPADSVVLVNAGVLTGRFPPLPAGAADVTVTNPDGQSGTLASGFSVAATVAAGPPRVNGITPAAGPLQGGVSASVSGSGFTAGARVFIGGRPAPAALLAGALVVTVPAGAGPGLADVAVTNSDGQSDVLPGGFNYFNAPPVLIGISPTCGAATGATQVVIDGRNLEPGVSATIGGQPLTGLVRSDSATLTGTTAASPVGAADVQVVNPDGQTDTIAGGFYFTDQTHPCQATTQVNLSLTRVVPGTGPNTGGTVITLVGQGFLSGATVTFGGASAGNVQLLGSGALTATLPAYSGLGPVNVAVALPDGRQAQLLGAFTYFDPSSLLPAPIVSAVSPSAGPNTGASVVEIDGENFVAGARVFFGGVEAQLPTLVSANQLIAVTPASLPGPVDVVVLNSDGKSGTLPDGFSYYPFGAAGAPPQAAQVSPRTGSTLTSTQASVIGSGFQPGAEVFIGGAVATNVQIQSDGSLAVTIAPQPAGTVDVTVTNPDGQSSTISQGFTFQPPAPQLTAIVPNDGPLAGGTTSVISGAGFLPTDLIAFGGVDRGGQGARRHRHLRHRARARGRDRRRHAGAQQRRGEHVIGRLYL